MRGFDSIMKKWWLFPVLICLGLLMTLAPYAMIFGRSSVSSLTANWAEFGEYVGGTLGTLFSFMTLVFLLTDRSNRDKEFEIQQYRSNLSQLFAIHINIVSTLDLRSAKDENKGAVVWSGRDCFVEYNRRAKRDAKKLIEDMPADLGAYLNSVRHIYGFIESCEFEKNTPYFLFSAQISDSELKLLESLAEHDPAIGATASAIRSARIQHRVISD